ncbi:MAG TPA: diguanylate cyclase [Rhodoferax sp.]|nr:diguanylate cyclase [Rhodoferax sp.]
MIDADILDASILIVDDQEANVRLLEEILLQTGYRHVTSTMSPQAVSGLHRANQYDLILLDLQMPVMDGFQVMACLKEIETTGYAPILVITAQPGHKQRALASGARDFVAKPFDLIELKTRIRNMLEVRLLYKQLAAQNAALAALALHDVLTGLPNRRLLMDRLSLAIAHARRNQRTMAVMFLDLDGFKQINDTMGHDAGDMLLRLFADRLVATVRQEDTVARLGGDEFVIALHEAIDVEQVAKLVSKVISAVAKPYRIQDVDVHMTVSVGVSVYPMHGQDEETLMKSADLALYEAKQAGKNDYRISAYADL